jgi:DNA-binding FrmR family transcriptional regulator
MPHIIRDKQKLLNRTKRIRGQVDAIEKALQEDQDCIATLQTLVACHGAMKSLMSEIIEDHVRSHVVDPADQPTAKQSAAAEELIEVIRSYLK